MAATPATPLTWCYRRCPATDSPGNRPNSAGTPPASPEPGRPSWTASATPGLSPRVAMSAPRSPTPWAARPPRAGRDPPQPPGHRPGRPPTDRNRTRTRRRRGAGQLPHHRLRVLPGTGHPTPDHRLWAGGFPGRPGRLDAGPRHRQLPQDPPRLPGRRAHRWPHPRPHPGQHHPVLADRHRRLRGPLVLGKRPRRRGGRPATTPVQVPVGFTTFPDEIFQAPHSWVERGYPTLSYYHQADQGGHFAAWEQPQLFTTELRAAFNSLR